MGILKNLVGLTLPISCLGCQTEGGWICDYCRANLSLSSPYRCALCGQAAENGLCDRCGRSVGLDGLISIFSYSEPIIQNLLKRGKYHGQFDGLRFLAEQYRREIWRRLPKTDWQAVPIPLHPSRLRQRGYNQVEILTRALWPAEDISPSVLVRTKATSPQAQLENLAARGRNVRGCFTVRIPPPAEVILVDDVVTSGATLREAARALRRAGTKTVWALTVAHG